MTKRLQVLIDDDEYHALQAGARGRRITLAQWVRQALRNAWHQREKDRAGRLAAIATAMAYESPVGDMEDMLDEIERGRSQR